MEHKISWVTVVIVMLVTAFLALAMPVLNVLPSYYLWRCAQSSLSKQGDSQVLSMLQWSAILRLGMPLLAVVCVLSRNYFEIIYPLPCVRVVVEVILGAVFAMVGWLEVLCQPGSYLVLWLAAGVFVWAVYRCLRWSLSKLAACKWSSDAPPLRSWRSLF